MPSAGLLRNAGIEVPEDIPNEAIIYHHAAPRAKGQKGGLDPPFLKDDGSPVTPADAAAAQAAEARAHGNRQSPGGFGAAVQKAAAANVEAGFTPEPTTRERLAEVQAVLRPAAEELPSLEEARALQALEQERLGYNPRGGLAARALGAATKADAAMKRAIEAGGMKEEAAAMLQSAETKLFGRVLPGGVASEATSYAQQNRRAGLFPPYHSHRHHPGQEGRHGRGGHAEGGDGGGA